MDYMQKREGGFGEGYVATRILQNDDLLCTIESKRTASAYSWRRTVTEYVAGTVSKQLKPVEVKISFDPTSNMDFHDLREKLHMQVLQDHDLAVRSSLGRLRDR